MNYPFAVSEQYFGGFVVDAVVIALLDSSQWFVCTPYPDGNWLITVKAENEHMLEDW